MDTLLLEYRATSQSISWLGVLYADKPGLHVECSCSSPAQIQMASADVFENVHQALLAHSQYLRRSVLEVCPVWANRQGRPRTVLIIDDF